MGLLHQFGRANNAEGKSPLPSQEADGLIENRTSQLVSSKTPVR